MKVKLSYKNAKAEVVEVGGSVRVEIDADTGIRSAILHPEALTGVQILPPPKPRAKPKAAAKPARKPAAKSKAKS